MVGLKDQTVCSKRCCNVKKPASETYEMLKVCVMTPWVENTPLNGVHVYKVVELRFRGLKVQFANRQRTEENV